MSLSTPAVHVPDSRPTVPAWLRLHLGWLFVAMVVLATAVLGTLVVVDGGGSTAGRVAVSEARTPTVAAEHGSIVAIDHAARSATVLDRGSIAAIDHRATAGANVPSLHDRSITAVDRGAPAGGASPGLLHESIRAIEHRTATGG
jgi:hypothetical protein